MLGRLGAAGDAVGEALLGRAALVAGGDVAGQEGVAGADRGDRLQRLGVDLEQAPLGALADRRDAAVGPGDRRLAGAEPDQLGEALGEVAAVGELLADQLLGLALVRGDHRGAGADAGQHRLALGVEHDRRRRARARSSTRRA